MPYPVKQGIETEQNMRRQGIDIQTVVLNLHWFRDQKFLRKFSGL